MTRNRYLLPALNTIGLLVMLALNALANALPINGMTTGAVSDKYDNLFVPAGLTFSIWGLIYLLLTAFVVYQWMVARSNSSPHSFVEKVGAWFFVSCLANAAWILAWHYELLPLSVLLMLVLLACLLAIYLRLGVGLVERHAERAVLRPPALQRVPRLDNDCHHRERLRTACVR